MATTTEHQHYMPAIVSAVDAHLSNSPPTPASRKALHPAANALLTLLLWATASSAGSEALESPYNPPMAINVRPGFVLDKITLTDRQIPVLLLSKAGEGSSRRPVVIALHGGGMPEILEEPGMTAKEAWFDTDEFHDAPYTLATAGCLVVIFDAWWAGERFRPEHRAMVQQNVFDAAVRGWVETARDVTMLIDALSDRASTDTTRVGLCGRSGGAITALMAARRDKRATAVTAWAGCADLVAFFRTKAPADVVKQLVLAAPEAKALLQEYDPIFGPRDLAPRAILMMNNRTDPAVPLALAEALYQKLRPGYSDNPERLQLRVLETPEPTHKMSKQDYDEGCAWLIQHLAP